MAAIKALEQWCKMQCDGYRDVSITNMTTSFRNGLAFCALLHKYRPDLIDYDSLKKEDVFENNRLAFQVAEDKLGIPALLDAEDMVALKIPDRLSILTYVSQYYNYFKGRPPMGGVKRPAEGSKEEPSEKKNQPVLAKILESKSGIENSLPSTVTARKSPKLDKAAAQRVVLADANKTGTLNSKCVACRSHVHLVQRHFVEGKLYHRSCFKCSECSCILHTGSYKPGKNPGTLVCNTHQSSSETYPLNAEVKTGFSDSAVPLNCAAKTVLAPPTLSSVLSAPINAAPKSLSPAQHSQSWTASAQKTQAARQKFFQAVPKVSESSIGNGKSIVPSGDPKVPLSSGDANRVRQMTGNKLGGENCNNNNKNLFTIRSAEKRFCIDPVSIDVPGLRKNNGSQDTAGNWEGRASTSQTNNEESQCLKTINKDNTRPTVVHKMAKTPIYQEWQTKLKHVKAEQGLKLPSAQTSAVPAFGFGPSASTCFKEVNPQKPLPSCESLGLKHGSCSPVKSPLRPPAVESVNSTTALDILKNPSAAKMGKYLSPTAAFRTEMRSPSWMCHHIPVEQIEKELDDIEMNLVQLEKEGVELEKLLRSYEEEGEGDILMDPLMVDWFNLIRKKQMYIRKESELVYLAKTQELEQQQPGVEEELRRLLEKPDHLKSRDEQHREKNLLQQLMEIVDGRNAIVEVLDGDRLREVEEDKQLNKMMQDLGVKKSKNKRKSSISKMFKRRSKRRVE
ncbi:MICAL-like protein 2 isoform X2 [Girardinichthys multiradiatus]|uniref:MICAL-like protein 2 isoform X2 n=1 Tax=Girardinichthys multiradiatus TaxID=208333 RepID=UPI001FAB9E02|nr:MICAL-like protein 2 isoform X2 [Girardinichthys multiradiatus]